MPRNERFTSDYQYKLQTLLNTITPYIISKYKDAPRETKNANYSLAYFVKVSLVQNGHVLTHSHTRTSSDAPGKQAFLKHCGKRRNFL